MSMQKNLLTGVLMIIFILSASNWNCVDLCASGALASWGSAGVGSANHIHALVDADGLENLVVHHAAYIED
jgi:hypothetical protein